MRVPGRVGLVKIEQQTRSTDREYSDGDSEDALLKLFKTGDAEKRREELLNSDPEWRLKYHIAYARENLLNWYDFKAGSSLLEVGSGCGALTGVFLKRCGQVDAVDISPRRSLINAYRHKNFKNLKIIIGNIQNLASRHKYDYATSVGVLEYSGRFIDSNQPYYDFLLYLNKLVKPGGTLILAIENKLGIKYWSGSREDHMGQLFSSVEGYPHDVGIKTFGKKELKQMLARTGFSSTEFYYPFPDYKMPTDIYSDEELPISESSHFGDMFPTPSPDQPREYLFAEDLAMKELSKNGLFSEFSNSFLVFAKRDK